MENSTKMQHLTALIQQGQGSEDSTCMAILASNGSACLKSIMDGEKLQQGIRPRLESLTEIARLVDMFERSHWLDFLLIKWPAWRLSMWLKSRENRKSTPKTT